VCQKEGCGEDSLGLLVAGNVGLLVTGIVGMSVNWGLWIAHPMLTIVAGFLSVKGNFGVSETVGGNGAVGYKSRCWGTKRSCWIAIH